MVKKVLKVYYNFNFNFQIEYLPQAGDLDNLVAVCTIFNNDNNYLV